VACLRPLLMDEEREKTEQTHLRKRLVETTPQANKLSFSRILFA